MGFRRYYIVAMIFLCSEILLAEWSQAENLSEINTEKDEFAPFINAKGSSLIFNSNRAGKSIFYEYQDSTLKILKGKINSTNKNSSYFTLKNKSTAIFSSFYQAETQSNLNLFYSNFIKNEWSEGKLIEELFGDYFASQPTVSADGKKLIFVSNKGNETQDTDLFISYLRADGKWDTPVNIDKLNTSGKEITPYFVGNDTLFFASDGQGGEGGFELFMSVLELGTWQRPNPISSLNTSYNESDPAFYDGTLIFTSDRPGGKGGLDLYSSDFIEEIIDSGTEEIDIEIESYVASINVNIKESGSKRAIFPYILFDKGSIRIKQKYKSEFEKLIELSSKDNNNVTLIAFIDSNIEENRIENNSKVIADKRLKKIINELSKRGLSRDEIQIKYETTQNMEKIPDNVLLLINNELPFQLREKEVKIEPDILQFFVYPKPPEAVSKINSKLFLNKIYTGIDTTNFDIPANVKFDLNSIAKEISNADSLILQVEAFTNNSTTKRRNQFYILKNINKNSADKFSFYLLSNTHLQSIYYKASLNKLMKEFYNGENLQINYNKKIEQSALESISNIFGSNIKINKTANIDEDYLIEIKKVK